MTAPVTWPQDWLARYVGLPFGTGPGQVTCWSLVCAFYRDELGIDLPAFGDIDPADLVRVAREMKRGEEASCWREPAAPVTGDVVLMRSARGGRPICHVGILADCRRVLHAEENTGSVIVPIDHFTIRHRIAGFRRYVTRMTVTA